MTRFARALLVVLAVGAAGASVPARAQFAVFDAQNYAENVLQAARQLQQINNQIQGLQNQVLMLENMARNLASLDVSQLDSMVSALTQVGGLMNQAQSIGFSVGASQAAFNQLFPQQYGASVTVPQLVADARQRWQAAREAFGQTMTVQAQVAQNVQADTATLSSLVTASQGAVGNLQAQQAVAQLVALSVKQQLQVQDLMAAQYRATALEHARQAETEEAARAAYDRFLGTDSAYTAQ
ncbi:P-type conjugative transfer protein TrbJ [Enhydrobacter aerosaccus]|uniref:P-type conjugative transfer protein TrbJ n=1 Tax=Enhydrobacter aerosaccus TaxID=225324 RepID=A0A1T4JLG8_9HYPH|nr:P-type conjugative transfer protein TrbJ [Enhydrobacter aerosaccus]SJZ31050.1 P-type conjugative transfer protein TrbJ [Enhydrobacter aerosaccus]